MLLARAAAQSIAARGRPFLRLFYSQLADVRALAAHPRASLRASSRYSNVVMASLVVAVLLVGTGPVPRTFAFFNSQAALGSNGVATAKLFALTDVTAVAESAAKVVLRWSDVSWASSGYSIRRATVVSGPFTQIGTTAAGVVTYIDSTGTNGTTYYYIVRGLSGLGGTGNDSSVVSAIPDSTAPTVSSTDPVDNTTNASIRSSSILVTFSEPMEDASTAANFALVACSGFTCTPGAAVTGVLSWQSPTKLYFVPNVTLSSSSYYGIKLTGGAGGATDLVGNALNATSGCQAGNISGNTCYRVFRTGFSTRISGVLGAAPGGGSTNVGTGSKIVLSFNKAGPSISEKTDMQNGFSLSPTCPTCGAAPYSSGFSWSNGSMTFTPPAALAASTTYTITQLVNGQTSSSGAGVNYSTTFTTGVGTDSIAPTVLQVIPNNGSTGIPITALIQITFSEPMRTDVTAAAFTLKAFTTGCSGAVGSSLTSFESWSTPANNMTFDGTANFVAGQCYQINVATTATDPSGNPLASAFTSTFMVLSGSAPTVALTGSAYYSGASVTSSGAGWSTGAGNVIPKWDDGTTLPGAGATVTANAFGPYSFTIPVTATVGSHYIQFARSGGPTVPQFISVRQPPVLVATASQTDISPGGSSTITVTAYDGGQPAANVGLSFTKTDPSARGSLSVASGVTNGSGQLATTLSVTAGAVFLPITVMATSGTVNETIIILDPPPLPPTALHLSATPDSLSIAWNPSPTKNVIGYRVYVGTATGSYDQDVDVGPLLTYALPTIQPNATYFAIVRAYDDGGGLSDPTPELSVAIPSRVPTQLLVSAQSGNLLATVLDQSGKPLSGVIVGFAGPPGVVLEPGSGATDAQGTLRSVASTSDPSLASTSIRATSGGLSATVEVTFGAVSPTPTASATASATATATGTPTPTVSGTPTPTTEPTATATPTMEPTMIATPTAEATATATPMATVTPTGQPTVTVEPLVVVTPSVVPTLTSTALVVATSSPAPTSTNTTVPTVSATPTPPTPPTASPTSTKTATPGAGTPTASPTPLIVCGATVTPTATSTATANPATPTASATATPTASATGTPTTCAPTSTPTATSTSTVPPGSTSTAVPAATASPTDVSATATPTLAPTAVPTNTPLPVPTSTNTPVPSPTPTPVPTAALPTSTPMPTPSPIPTAPASPPPTATPKPGP